MPIPPEGFASRSPVHFELTDEVRARAIKRAHDLGASLVEFHSHTGPWPAAFSPTDIIGFREFVPHVWWRLKGRPYIAVVVAPAGFDAALWVTGPETITTLDGIMIESELLRPTGLTNWDIDDERSLRPPDAPVRQGGAAEALPLPGDGGGRGRARP